MYRLGLMKEIVIILVIMFLPFFSCSMEKKLERPTAVAGQFYPLDKNKLIAEVSTYLGRAEKKSIPGKLIALLVPHAGYVFSGPTAAYSYKLLEGQKFSTVVIIGLAHRYPLEGAALFSEGGFQTPLGTVAIDENLNKKLAQSSPLIKIIPQAHLGEHSIEVQLPFLQYLYKDFKFVPILIGNPEPEVCEKIGDAIGKAIKNYSDKDRSVLLIASSDMSHYPRSKDAANVDRGTLSVIEEMDCPKLHNWDNQQLNSGIPNLHCTLCGLGAVLVTLSAAKVLGADKVTILNYTNSGKISGDDSQVVGYAALAFSAAKKEDFALTPRAQKELLSLARESINYFLKYRKFNTPALISTESKNPAAVFVTLKENGELRGCIGQTQAYLPLAEAVVKMAVAAAVEDYRFSPLTPDELKNTHIEISVLSPLQEIKSPDQIILGKHGVIVSCNGRAGLFLPQVAQESGWSKEKFLSELCTQKAGLSATAWQDGQAKLSIFTVFSFEEEN